MSEGRHTWPRVMWQQCYVTPCHVPWMGCQASMLSWWAPARRRRHAHRRGRTAARPRHLGHTVAPPLPSPSPAPSRPPPTPAASALRFLAVVAVAAAVE